MSKQLTKINLLRRITALRVNSLHGDARDEEAEGNSEPLISDAIIFVST
jgi:hypothetical protein